ncbi:MAG: hypothetical protein RL514_546 [Verrucomicrobiota bacterium]|jgi:hypothetical protein
MSAPSGSPVLAGICACLLALDASALEVLRPSEPQHVFADGARAVEVRFHNATAETARVEVRLQLLQLTSATAAPVGGVRAWKTLTVLPGQTVVESAPVAFPSVRVATRFAARWLGAGGNVLGVTEVWAHPDDCFEQLKNLLGEQPIGVQEHDGGLRATLTARGLTVVALNSAVSWEEFRGRLAFRVSDRDSAQDESAFLTAAKAGLAVVWLQTTPTTSPPAAPVAERERHGRGSLVVAPAALLAHLDHSVTAQLTLLRLAELALKP